MGTIHSMSTPSRLFVTTFIFGLALTSWAPTANATYPGGNGALAFVRNDASATGDVWSMNADGSAQRQLSDTVYGYDPAWSADGRTLAFSDLVDLWTMNADGSMETQLTTDLIEDRNPDFFPSGRAIVFDRAEPGGGSNLYRLALTLSGQPAGAPARLTTTTEPGVDNRKPVVSPDGSRIAFESDRDGDYEIYVIRAAGETSANPARQLTRNTIRDFEPDWSPNGRMLLLVHGNDVWKMNADGSRQTRLTGRASIEERGPVWSPDGAKIAFQRFSGGNYEIFVMNAVRESTTNPAVNVTRNPADDFTPSWQPLP